MKRIVLLLGVLVLVLAMPMAVFAEEAEPNNEDISITVDAGEFYFTGGGLTIGTGSFDLDGGAQMNVTDQSADQWEIEDSTGSDSGWYVSLAAGNLTCSSPSDTLTVTDTVSSGHYVIKVTILSIAKAEATSSAVPTTSYGASYQSIDSSINALVAADNQGMGSYTVDPDYDVTLPADAVAGEYTGTMTQTMTQGSP